MAQDWMRIKWDKRHKIAGMSSESIKNCGFEQESTLDWEINIFPKKSDLVYVAREKSYLTHLFSYSIKHWVRFSPPLSSQVTDF